ncbi:putative transposase [Enhygromyxa salina]|uniref:Putative transposase n=1 Tax=Enhygromyxa salina TaxID=215803 RepID=A0A2S9XMH0_9BACT|nr:transposase zinc-binding domain-containing protein [Enhygromyxa salina]PRP94047.1 putative transposase [Enhygromyxa salina]
MRIVVDEFDAYLRCGLLEHDLAHFSCRRCGHSRVVAFSCKRRGFCPSCLGRRMSDVAAHLVDELLPEVPARQWVCSLPWRLRYAMGYDKRLCSDVLAAFIGAVRRSLRWRAKRELGLRSVEDAQVGGLTFIQRADSSLRLNVHFHCLVLDGVYVREAEGGLRFHELRKPNAEELVEVARWTYEALARVMARHGRSLEGCDTGEDELSLEQPALASCYSASLSDRQLLGAAPGERTRKLVHPVRELSSADEGLAEVGGVNVHVGAEQSGPVTADAWSGCPVTWPDPRSLESASN